MTEPVMNMDQIKVAHKVSSALKISLKQLMASVDAGALQDNVLYFPDLAHSELGFHMQFYVAQGKFNLGQVLNAQQFKRTALYEAWLTYTAASIPKDYPHSVLAYGSGPGVVWGVTGYTDVAAYRNEAGIVLGYDYLPGGAITMQPLQHLIRAKYPPLPP